MLDENGVCIARAQDASFIADYQSECNNCTMTYIDVFAPLLLSHVTRQMDVPRVHQRRFIHVADRRVVVRRHTVGIIHYWRLSLSRSVQW